MCGAYHIKDGPRSFWKLYVFPHQNNEEYNTLGHMSDDSGDVPILRIVIRMRNITSGSHDREN